MASWTTPRVANVGDIFTAAWYNAEIKESLIYLKERIKEGDFKYSGQTADHGPWLACHAGGRSVSRTTYAALFTLYNSYSPALPYGVGDGSTTFGLPDPGGRTLVIKGAHADVDAFGDSDGVISANRSPKHNTTNALTLPNHGHSHTLTLPNHKHNVPYQVATRATGGSSAVDPVGAPDANILSSDPTSAPPINGAVGNPTSNPAIGGSIGPGGTLPVDSGAYLVAGNLFVHT